MVQEYSKVLESSTVLPAGTTAIVVYYKDAEGNENHTEYPVSLGADDGADDGAAGESGDESSGEG